MRKLDFKKPLYLMEVAHLKVIHGTKSAIPCGQALQFAHNWHGHSIMQPWPTYWTVNTLHFWAFIWLIW